MPDAELRTADHILPASAPDTRALFEGRGLIAVDITEFEKLGGVTCLDVALARLRSAIDV